MATLHRISFALALSLAIAGSDSVAPGAESGADVYRRLAEGLRKKEAPNESESQPSGETPAPSAATPAPLSYEQLVARIQTKTEELWGKRLAQPIKSNVLNQQALADLLKKLLAEELDDPANKTLIEQLRILKLFPEGDAAEIFQVLLEGQVGGLYNPEDKSLYVVDTFDPKGFMGGVILSHEITHAIQDQEWDLAAFMQRVENLDTRRARQSVAEGDATVLMIQWGQENFSPAVFLEINQLFGSQMNQLNDLPPAMVQDLIFPYLEGAKFITALTTSMGPAWRQKIVANPPQSSEQILHPEKYLGTLDLPRHVSLPAAPEGWSELGRNTAGEWTTRLFLVPEGMFPRMSLLNPDPMVKEPIASKAAEGWGGDQFALLAPAGSDSPTAINWRTEWDSPTDADEFQAGLLRKFHSWSEASDLPATDSLTQPSRWEGTAGARRIRVHRVTTNAVDVQLGYDTVPLPPPIEK
jgi:hypothetical protein